MGRLIPALGVLAAIASAAAVVWADEVADRIRVQEKAFAPSVAWLKMTITSEDGSETDEATCSGVSVLHDGGPLLVVPGEELPIQSIRILLGDGKEAEAEVVARDADMGLMFVRPRKAEEVKGLPLMDLAQAVTPLLGDPMILIDRRSPDVVEDTVCRPVRVICRLETPRLAYFYTGLSSEQMGGMLVTPEGGFVGIVGLVKETTPDGQEMVFAAGLPAAQILAALDGIQKP